MNTMAINQLINQIYTIKCHIQMYENDPSLMKNYRRLYNQLKRKHGDYLRGLLFDIYDEYCSNSDMHQLCDYISPKGVSVEADDFPGIQAKLFLKSEPLRITVQDLKYNFEEVLWKAS